MTRNFSRIAKISLVWLSVVAFGGAAMAATDGTLGLTSIGTTDISIIKGDTAQITGLTDIVLVPWTDKVTRRRLEPRTLVSMQAPVPIK